MDRWGRAARKKQPWLVPWLALAILKWINSNKVEIPREEGGLDFKHIQHKIKHYQSGWCLQDALVRSILMVAPPPTLLFFEEKPGVSWRNWNSRSCHRLLFRWVLGSPPKALSIGEGRISQYLRWLVVLGSHWWMKVPGGTHVDHNYLAPGQQNSTKILHDMKRNIRVGNKNI